MSSPRRAWHPSFDNRHPSRDEAVTITTDAKRELRSILIAGVKAAVRDEVNASYREETRGVQNKRKEAFKVKYFPALNTIHDSRTVVMAFYQYHHLKSIIMSVFLTSN